MKFKNYIAIFGLSFLLEAGFVGSTVTQAQEVTNSTVTQTQKITNSEDTYKYLNLFGDVFERVRSDYVEEKTDEEIIEAAISGMLSALDPHSSYLNARKYTDMRVNTRGEFGGLGIQVSMDKGFIKVISPIDDTPAFRAGVEAGDYITHLDEESVQGMTLTEAVDKMRGKVGEDIILTIRRTGDSNPIEITITRAVIKITSVRSHTEENVGYIRITSFNEKTTSGLTKAFDKINKKIGEDLQGIVLDLRNNPGGLLNQAISVSDAFLERGEIVSTRSRKAEDTQRFNANPGDLAGGLPVVILINGGSASASEIVAGALQDHRRAVVLGTRSFGKGSVQTILPIPGHGAMRLTTARYYTPSGRSIQGLGIEPDIEVIQSTIKEIKSRSVSHESDLRGALKNDNSERKSGSEKNQEKNEEEDVNAEDAEKNLADHLSSSPDYKPQDYQLMRALDLIRGVSLFSVNKS